MPQETPNFHKMQRDAEQRIRNMQQRADKAIGRQDMPPVPNFVKTGRPFQASQQPQTASSTRQPNNAERQQQQTKKENRSTSNQRHEKPYVPPAPHSDSSDKGGIFSRFKGLNILKALNFQNIHIDNDVLIIIALIFLMSTEETDELLLLALVYIML